MEALKLSIKPADLSCADSAQEWLQLLDAYASDPMGGGKPLSDYTRQHLVTRLNAREDFVSFIAYVDALPVGLINAFEGFSTFNAKPLFNVHDLVVVETMRGHGIAKALLNTLVDYAKSRDCCKLTIEVLSNNVPAQRAYRAVGFSAYELDPTKGHALFWELPLTHQ